MAKEIRRFSQEQIDRANAVNVIDYARSQGIEVVQSSGEWPRATISLTIESSIPLCLIR